ncbi:GNAT family N-acetyltransferase [Streptomyces sp. CA-253872]|uniref:GNAT family N-acetyltransferase n=1 Tax=Streptomyces sp. CA-253872 TaxID=3240067 RepID=UPI003D8CEE43
MSSGSTARTYEGAEITRRLDDFIGAYEEVYSDPPYSEGPRDVADFIESYRRQARRDGARLALAHDGDELIGFAFGFPLPSDTRWWQNVEGVALPADFTREDGRRTFAVIELAVRKPWRRRGVARGLHDRLLDGTGIERSTLTVRPEPEALPAQAAYRSWGYTVVGTSHPWDTAPYYTAMVRPLPGETAARS